MVDNCLSLGNIYESPWIRVLKKIHPLSYISHQLLISRFINLFWKKYIFLFFFSEGKISLWVGSRPDEVSIRVEQTVVLACVRSGSCKTTRYGHRVVKRCITATMSVIDLGRNTDITTKYQVSVWVKFYHNIAIWSKHLLLSFVLSELGCKV